MKGHKRITRDTQLKTWVQICNREQPRRNAPLIVEWEPRVKGVLSDDVEAVEVMRRGSLGKLI